MQWHKSVDGLGWESGGYRVRRHPKSTRWVAAYQPIVHWHAIDGFCRRVIPGPHETSKEARAACERHHEQWIRESACPAT